MSGTDADRDAAAGADPEAPPDGDGRDARTGVDPAADRGREVVVPMRLYKTVTVLSTLVAVASVVAGFTVLDAATLRTSLVRRLVTGLLSVLGLSVPAGALDAALAALGLAIVGFGAGVYVLGTRFRAPGMGKSQEDADEGSDDG